MNNSRGKYTPEDILQILIDWYNCQAVYDPEVDEGEQLTFNTSINDWSSICDLLEPLRLAQVHQEFFNLKSPIEELESILINGKENTLKGFCEHVAKNAEKEVIEPITSLGQSCMSAAIFKTLIVNLKNRGVDTKTIKPSSEFIPLFNKYGVEMLEEVNKLVPGALTEFEYKDNRLVRTGWAIIGIFILLMILVPLIWQFHWALLIPLGIGAIVIAIGNKFKPEKEIVGGYNTVRDLIVNMQVLLNKPPHNIT